MGTDAQRARNLLEDALGAAYTALSAARGNYSERRRRRGESAEFKAAFARASFISGWLNRKEAELLFELASAVRPGRDIVEVGSYLGRSTAFLALAAGSDRTVHAVDPFDNGSIQLVRGDRFDTSKQFQRNMEEIGVADRVQMHKAISADAAESYSGRPIDLLFVDGDHSEKAVYQDGSLWAPHLAPDCLVAFDDITWEGVTKGLQRLVADGFIHEPVGTVDKIAICGPIELWPQRVRDVARPFSLFAAHRSYRSFFRRFVAEEGSAAGPNPHPARLD